MRRWHFLVEREAFADAWKTRLTAADGELSLQLLHLIVALRWSLPQAQQRDTYSNSARLLWVQLLHHLRLNLLLSLLLEFALTFDGARRERWSGGVHVLHIRDRY